MEERVVFLENIKKSYRLRMSRKSVDAVNDISLSVRSGEVFGLLGPNGAGKTTTLKILLGIIYPDRGEGALLGRPLGDRQTRGRLGFLPEQPYFYGFMTAEKALDLYGKFFGIGRSERQRRAGELLEKVGLRPGSHLTLDKYSKGMLQRFGIAQALLNDPELVIMDEPSGGLDPVGQKEVRDILLRLKEEGKTIFLSSHQLSEVENICDSVSIVNRGNTVGGGNLAELLAVEGRTRIVLDGDEPVLLERLRSIAADTSSESGRTEVSVDRADTYRVLDVARELGVPVVKLEPYRRSLEDLFIETVRETSD